MEALEGEVVAAQGRTRLPATRDAPQHIRDAQVDPAAIEMIFAALPENTRRAYRSAWAKFARWCGEHGRVAEPAAEGTLLSWLAELERQEASPSTVWVSFSAIRKRHMLARRPGEEPMPWNWTEQLGMAVKGYTIRRLEAGWRPQRARAARPAEVRAMADTCDPETTAGIRDRALILTDYKIGGRCSELRGLRIADIAIVEEGMTVTIAMSKTDKSGHGAQVAVPWAKRNKQYCPVRATQAWIRRLREDDATAGALFRPVDRHGHIRHPSRLDYTMHPSAIEDLFDRRARAAGIEDKIVPHSMRRGMATNARRAGADLIAIARHGRWNPASPVFMDYMDEVDKWLKNPASMLDL